VYYLWKKRKGGILFQAATEARFVASTAKNPSSFV